MPGVTADRRPIRRQTVRVVPARDHAPETGDDDDDSSHEPTLAKSQARGKLRDAQAHAALCGAALSRRSGVHRAQIKRGLDEAAVERAARCRRSRALAGFAASASLIVAIGAQNAFVLRQGLQQTERWGVVAICVLGDVSLIACGVAGIGALIRDWPGLLQVMRYGGAAFIGAYGLQAA